MSQTGGGTGDGDAGRVRGPAQTEADNNQSQGSSVSEAFAAPVDSPSVKSIPLPHQGAGEQRGPLLSAPAPPPSSSGMAPPPLPSATQQGDSLALPPRVQHQPPVPQQHATAPSSVPTSQPVFIAPDPVAMPLSSQPPLVISQDKPVSQPSPDTQQARGMAALPSKAKIPMGSEDGSRRSRQDSDQSSDPPLSARSRAGADRQRRSSRDSEEVSNQLRHSSAFQPVSRPRKTTMSPATTLWDNTSSGQPTSNILLAPAMPLIVPSLNAYAGEGKTDTSSDTSRSLPSERSPRGPDTSRRLDRSSRERDDVDRSFDSLDELDSDYRDTQRDRSYRSERNDRYPRDPRDSRYNNRDKEYDRPDRPQSRSQYQYERPSSRADRPSSRAERPASRSGYGGKEDQYRRYRGYYRDYGDSYYDERYDRPRSRQDESRRSSRPSSRSGHENDRPRSRADPADRDRDQYYRDRHRGYDNYGRTNADYFAEEREKYNQYYRDRQAKYNQGYYEEYYGTKHAEQYQQQQQQQPQQSQDPRSRPYSRQEADRASNSSQSRGNTPGLPSEANQGQDYYNQRARPYSRNDYARDYYYQQRGYDPYAYYDGYGYDPYAYGQAYPGYEDPYNQSSSYDQGRLTPPKYSYPHVRACFGPNGQLIKVLPNRPTDGQPATVELQDVQTLLQECPDAEELHKFPGPLTRANTHKKDVLLFCQQRARACLESIDMIDRESAQLIWRLLELLIKQNGSIVGTDLSDLLLDGHEPSTHEYRLHGMRISSQSPAVSEEGEGSSRESPAVRVTSDRTVISAVGQMEQWTDRFRHLLLYGRKKDALECAMKNNLWGHALFLASKMDTRTHASVMTRFANSAMRMNDPLQTLYQLMSGRQPAAVTCVVDERWGDWRPHLAMVLSNQTSRHELDRKTICTLGDTLAAKGCLHASHFCYLMAQVNLGSYFKKTSKVVLIGSNHNLSMEEFATNEAIQCTEVYEYAQTLGNPNFCLPHFQIYKYLYACKLADYGLTSEALHYCEMIASTIQQCPSHFQPPFVKLVFQLSSKLKFSDPQRLHTSEDAADPLWMQGLDKISQGFEDGSIQPVSGTATPANLPGTTASSESGEYNPHTYPGDPSAATADTDSAGYAQQQQAAGHPAIAPNATSGVSEPLTSQGQDSTDGTQQQAAYSQQQYDYSQWHQQYGYQYPGYGADPSQQQQQQQQQQQTQQGDQQQQQATQGGYQHVQAPATQPGFPQQQPEAPQAVPEAGQPPQQYYSQGHADPTVSAAGYTPYDPAAYPTGNSLSHHGEHDDSSVLRRDRSASFASSCDVDCDDGEAEGQQPVDPSGLSSQPGGQLAQQQPPAGYGSQPPHKLQHQPSVSTTETTEDEDEEEDDEEGAAGATGFDYFGNVGGGGQVVAPPHRYRTLSGSSQGSMGHRRRTTSGGSTGSVKRAPPKSGTSHPQPAGSGSGPDGRKGAEQPGANGSGWFGGIFSKFGRNKGKKEMILPDDKNPAIVWDPDKKKWVNADGTEEEVHTAAPPPKDMDLMGGPPKGPPSSQPSGGPPPPTAGPPSGNRFSLKAKGARNQYVDVNNPKPLSVPTELFNVMPPTTSQPTPGSDSPQVFSPQGSNDANNSSGPPAGTLGVPTASSSVNDAPPTSGPSVSAPPAMPMLFNPATLKAGGQASTGSSGTGLKYGQRRAYPK